MQRKKILILAGAGVHCKLVEAAKKQGLYVIVTDNIDNSPAKTIADESWGLSITAVDEIVKKCKDHHVSAVISGWIDPAQVPYAEICHKLGFPCYGGLEQFLILTNKKLFKKACIANKVNVIPEYSIQDIDDGIAVFPLFIKPANSRGSRGQTICYSKENALRAIEVARMESYSNDILIESYIEDESEFQVTYFFINGKAYLIRTADSYVDENNVGLDRVVSYSISPSRYTDIFIREASETLIKMLQNIGVKNGPVFFQGFYNKLTNKFCFFDPGYRFPGTDFERVVNQVFDTDFASLMVNFSINGEFPKINDNIEYFKLENKYAAILFPAIYPGKIQKISGLLELYTDECVVSIIERTRAGATILSTGDIGQRLAEICLLCTSEMDLIEKIMYIYEKINIMDANDNNMLIKPLRYLSPSVKNKTNIKT